MSKNLIFAPKTGVLVLSKQTKEVVGRIEYYTTFKQFVFEPTKGTTFSSDCLADIETKLKELNKK